MRLSADPIVHDRAPPLLGEHTEEVLRSILGMDGASIERLRAERVIQGNP
jgi:crotonobetainyl-CoA:carnitine CoA-transferase CaiB-like acyl-CoA transferase